MTNKGFGNEQKPRLYKGWLLKEVKNNYSKTKGININCLRTLLCANVAAISVRRAIPIFPPDKMLNAALASHVLVSEIDEEFAAFEVGSPEMESFLNQLLINDDFYVEYIYKLYDTIKRLVLSGRSDRVNGLFQQSNDFKRWVKESGALVAETQLINGYMHPLSEIDGETMNLWASASVFCGAATGRDIGEARNGAIAVLVDLGVKIKNLDQRLSLCQVIDSEYLKLVSEVKELLEEKFDESFNKI